MCLVSEASARHAMAQAVCIVGLCGALDCAAQGKVYGKVHSCFDAYAHMTHMYVSSGHEP